MCWLVYQPRAKGIREASSGDPQSTGCTLALLPAPHLAFPWDTTLINTGPCPHLESATRFLAHRTGAGQARLTHEECGQECPLQAITCKCRNITLQTRQCLPL